MTQTPAAERHQAEPREEVGRIRQRRRSSYVIQIGATVAGAVVALIANLFIDSLPALRLGDFQLWLAVAGLLISVLASGFTFFRRRTTLESPDSGEHEGNFRKRIERATGALQEGADLVRELHAEIQTRMTALERIRTESAEYERLAALRKEEAEAVSRLVATVMKGQQEEFAKKNRRDQAVFFALGLLVSIPIGVVINLLTN